MARMLSTSICRLHPCHPCTGSETEEARGASASLRCRHVRIRSRCWRAPGRLASIVPCAIKCGAMVTMPSAVATIRSASLCACKCRKCLRRDSDRGSGAGRRPRAKGNPANHRYSVSRNNRSGCPPTVAISSGSIILRPQCLLLPVSSSLFKHQGGFVGFFSYFSTASIECVTYPLPDILLA